MKITAAVISYNEERKINSCLSSLFWADEIIVIDSSSTDRTRDIASDFTSRIYITETDTSYYVKRNLAIKHAENDWIFFLDCDEYADKELINSLQAIKKSDARDCKGYKVNRKNLYMNKWIKHGGLYPDYQLRLFNRNHADITPRFIHEGVEVKGETLVINNGHIIHNTVDNIEHMINKINHYSTLQAAEWLNEGRSANKAKVLLNPAATFLKTFFIRKAFLDGMEGFLAAFNYSFVNFLSYLKLRKLQTCK
jgi:glycosyltransferase involved in cell wall biosynthesis